MAAAAVAASVVVTFVLLATRESGLAAGATFKQAAVCSWGKSNCVISGDNLTLVLNSRSGSAIESKEWFLFGKMEMKIKLVPGDSAGTVTTYYIYSTGEHHDEVDFEFLGNVTGEPYTIHTNIYVNGRGEKEVQFKPWFDPCADYHKYSIFWNPHQIVWYVDDVPIRVFRNLEREAGIPFPRLKPMKAYASIWDADWATQGGRIQVNWDHQPFAAKFVEGLSSDKVCTWHGPDSTQRCSDDSRNWWYSRRQFRDLDEKQMEAMLWVRENFMVYDYCVDYERYKGAVPPECAYGPAGKTRSHNSL